MRKCAETLSELGSAGNGGRGVPSAMAAESVEEGGARAPISALKSKLQFWRQ